MHPVEKALREIERFVICESYFPSFRELAKQMNVSKGSIQNYVLALEKMKLVKQNRRGNIISISEPPKDIEWSSAYYLLHPTNAKRRG